MDRLENFKVRIAVILIAEAATLFVLYMTGTLSLWILPTTILLILNTFATIWIASKYECDKEQHDVDTSHILGHDTEGVLFSSEVGVITYDEQYNVTWINGPPEGCSADVVGKELAGWVPETTGSFSSSVDELTASGPSGGCVYEIARKEDGQVLFVRDITKLETITERFKKDSIVAGLLQPDDYMEIQQYEDEGTVATINTQLRQSPVEWVGRYGMSTRRLRPDRFLTILDEVISERVVQDKLDILSTIRKSTEGIDVSITLSMSSTRGTDDLRLLDTMVSDFLELAQSRDGDRTVVKECDESVKYPNKSSEAREKRSKVRVRAVSQVIKEAIMEANRVFVIGHQSMDLDCMGSALCMSRLATAYDKEAYVMSDNGGVEPQLQEALMLYREKSGGRHRSISDGDATKVIENDDLLIAAGHHNPKQTGAPRTLEAANCIVVIDHHHRSEDFVSNLLLVYVGSGVNSVYELATEFLPYRNNKVNPSGGEATLMYAGILVDTNRFKIRTGSRTFEAVAYLKNLGADPAMVGSLLKEDFDDFEIRTEIMKYVGRYAEGIPIAAVDNNRVINRTLTSQATGSLLNIKGVEVSSITGNIESGKMAMSARSKRKISVQIIMENAHGSGHSTMAALQRERTMVKAVQEELKQVVDTYLKGNKEDNEDESDTAK